MAPLQRPLYQMEEIERLLQRTNHTTEGDSKYVGTEGEGRRWERFQF